jgi:hypothetical protein
MIRQLVRFSMAIISVADPYPGSRIRCLFDPWIQDPDSGIGFFPILDSDLGSRLPDLKPIFCELNDNFLGKKFYNFLQIGPKFFLRLLKIKIIFNFVIFVATKKGRTRNFSSPFSFVAVFGSEIRDPGWKKIMIRDKHPGSATLAKTL